MSFVEFLVNVGKMATGYVVGGLLFLSGFFAYTESSVVGVGMILFGLVLVLYAVYTGREM